MSTTQTNLPARRRANGWPVLPLRIFLAAVFLFAGYAKLAYPHFFDPASLNGYAASVRAAKTGTPIGGLLSPLSEHPSLYGHLTAVAELAIGLGLLVGLLTRVAALGGMVLMVLIVLSVDWGAVKQYTGSSGWFTSVDLAVAAALSVFLLGGADPFSLDGAIWRARHRERERDRGLDDDYEPAFGDSLAESRARLQAEPYRDEYPTDRLPAGDDNTLWNDGRGAEAGYDQGAEDDRTRRITPARPEQSERR